MRILLVNPNSRGGIGLDQFLRAPPLNLMYLSGAVKPLGHEVDLVDLKYSGRDVDGDLLRQIRRADLVGVTSLTPSIASALEVARAAKELGKPTILGGYHPSLVPETCLAPEVDVTVQGEGEQTFVEFVTELEASGGKLEPSWLKRVRGISFEDHGRVQSTPPRPFVKDLDQLPFPDRSLVARNKYSYFGATVDSLESARGCVGRCNFCCVRPHWGGRWRAKSPGRVIREIAQMNQRRRWFTFQDSEFTLDMKRVARIFKLVTQFGYDQRWYSAQGRLDDVVRHPEVVAKMADGGFKMLFVGIESTYQRSLDYIGKRLKLDQVRRGVKILHDHGITIFGSILIGNVGETYEMVERSIEFAHELDVDIMQFTALTPLPKTELYAGAKRQGWIEKDDWSRFNFCDPVMRTPDLTTRQIRELVIKAYSGYYNRRFLEHFGWKFLRDPKFRWFFRMAAGFLRQAPKVFKFLRTLQARSAEDRDPELARDGRDLSAFRPPERGARAAQAP
ncbi:MAG: radical SAM protein [Promethearchaeota archaeon]